MWYAMIFVVGVLLGSIIAKVIFKPKTVGTLVIDVVDPMNDQPFLLELNTGPNDIYYRKQIVLDVDNGARK